VPRYAAVNESVELVRRERLERAVPFTNAVLRRLADEGRAWIESLPDSTWAEAAVAHSYPDWVAETWWRDLGAEGALALMRAQNAAPATVVRLVRGEIDGEPDPDVPGAWHVEHMDDAAFAEGRVWPQSAGSQLAGLAVGSTAGERVLDLCAAPGGKATMLAGDVVAVELNEARARELEENVRRLGATNVRVVCADGRDLPADLAGFDRALVDAPCSGLGVLAARPDLRWRSHPLPELQLELLRAAAARVRPGGTVTYSVCTVNRDEAEAVVDASGLAVDDSLAAAWPHFRHAIRPEFLQTLPHVHGTSGFFVARLLVG
jgi:16S rRNA (cytosine967-C5)-methyltransferase